VSKKRFTPKQIIRRLRGKEVPLAQGHFEFWDGFKEGFILVAESSR
jgi:hypothetical protein